MRDINDVLQNALINAVTIFLGLGVGSKLAADKFLVPETLGIMAIGLAAFAAGTAAGVLMAKIMNKFSKVPINPLIGSAGVSAVPMAARVSNKVAMDEDRRHIILNACQWGPKRWLGVIGVLQLQLVYLIFQSLSVNFLSAPFWGKYGQGILATFFTFYTLKTIHV